MPTRSPSTRHSLSRGLRSITRADTHEDMDFGIVTAKVDEIGYIAHAENLGYSHCWVSIPSGEVPKHQDQWSVVRARRCSDMP